MSLKSRIKEISPDFVKDAWRLSQTPAKQKFYNQLKNFVQENKVINKLFSEDLLRDHYAGKVIRNNVFHPDLFINQIRYFRLYEYFQNHYPEMFDERSKIVYVGDSSGVLLKAMNKNGLAVNINKDSVEQIKSKGVKAQVGSIYQLPFPDKSFDYSMSFQCLEHLEAPFLALKELERITKKRVFISIPYIRETRIYPKKFWENLVKLPQEKGGWDVKEIDKDCDYHIIEFSSKDFISLMSYTNLRCEYNYSINYLEPLGTSKENKGSYFNFFDLKVES
jgi:ubiquinone/menaquinone biosynthesis C-methylase UbiE